jgi:hypothetical protein
MIGSGAGCAVANLRSGSGQLSDVGWPQLGQNLAPSAKGLLHLPQVAPWDVPQFEQNLAPGERGLWHLVQVAPWGAPQWLQKREPAGMDWEHLIQLAWVAAGCVEAPPCWVEVMAPII